MEINVIKNLKRYFKKKIKITESLIVTFLITGGFLSTVNVAPASDLVNNDIISGSIAIAMTADGLNSSAINNGILSNSLTSENTFGIYATNFGKGINNGTISNSSDSGNSFGMFAINSGDIENNGIISNSSNSGVSIGMYVPISGTATNYGTITNKSNTGKSYGMYGDALGAIITNEGIINTDSTTEYPVGMKADSGSQGINNGNIETNRKTAIGMYAKNNGSTVTNNKNISGVAAMAMVANYSGANAINSTTGIITKSSASDPTAGMYATNSGIATNYGKILNSSDSWNSYGMFATKSGTVVNASSGTILNKSTTGNSTGMYGETLGVITNYGTVNATSSSGSSTGMQVDTGSIATNTGTISNSSDSGNSYGMSATNSGSIAINTGTISNSSDSGNSYGMFALDSGDISNSGTIKATSTTGSSTGMRAESGGQGTNSGDVILDKAADTGMYAYGNGSAVTNNKNISGAGSKGMIADGLGAKATNGAGGKISNSVTSGDSYGMFAQNSGIATNFGTISNSSTSGNSYGMFALDSGATILNSGTISATSAGFSIGMRADSGGQGINNNEIILAKAADIGMYAGEGSVVTNNKNISGAGYKGMVADGLGAKATNGAGGKISNSVTSGDSYGMYTLNSGTATNFGTISNSSDSGDSYGMFALNSGTATNFGTISNSSTSGNSYGMFALDSGATILNSGTISATSAGFSIGMRADSGGQGINNNEIILAKAADIGMYAGEGSVVTNNKNISGAGSKGMVADGLGAKATNGAGGKISNSVTSGDSYGMYALNSGTATNFGTISNTSTSGDSYGMFATGSKATAENNGRIETTSAGSSTGMRVESGGQGTNNNEIILAKTADIGMYAKDGGSTVTNNKNIGGAGSNGMIADGLGAKATNGAEGKAYGNISNSVTSGDSYGMFALNSGTATNFGTISNSSTSGNSYGMFALDSGATILNSGTISATSTTGFSTGMRAESGGQGTNNNEIILAKTADIGMYAKDGGSTVTNNKNISGAGSKGMIADGLGAKATNGAEGKAYGNISNSVTSGDSYGMFAQNSGIATNFGTISNSSTSGNSYGMFALDSGATILNSGTISATSAGFSIGMRAESGGQGINNNEIILAKASDIGMYAYGNGSAVTNNKNISGAGSKGMIADGLGAKATNGAEGKAYGNISNSVTSGDSYGMFALNSGTATNFGTISNTSTSGDSYGMFTKDSTILNYVGGTIANKALQKNSYGMFATGSKATAENNGRIETTSAGSSTGMRVESGGQGTNNNEIILAKTADIGMYAKDGGSTVTNNKNISGAGYKGMIADGLGANAINGAEGKAYGNILNSVTSGDSYGMSVANSGIATNYGTISNSTTTGNSYGMYVENSGTASNYGTISNTSTSSDPQKELYGMLADGPNAKATNEKGGKINVSGNYFSYGMYARNSGTAINNGDINLNKLSDVAMYAAESSTVTNNKNISGISYMAVVADGLGAKAINGIDGKINTSGSTSSGMYADFSGEATNYGTISNTSISGTSFGMHATSLGSKVTNLGIISNTSTSGKSYGMSVTNSGTAINGDKGIINVISASSSGMYAVDSGTAINGDKGIINVISASSSGMYGARIDSTIENEGIINVENKGTINVNSINSYGMYGTGVGSTINNSGNINVNINADGSTGMHAEKGAKLVNSGTINLNSTNGIGIHATDSGTTVENSGKIFIKDTLVSDKENIETIYNTTRNPDKNGNQAILIEKGATFTNIGLFSVNGELNTSSTANNATTGKFVVAGGTVQAQTIKGDIYASGALTTAGYANSYTTPQLLQTDNMLADIKSDSAMFDAILTEADINYDSTTIPPTDPPTGDAGLTPIDPQTNNYGIEMVRKDFNEIIDDPSIAAYLENNYTAENYTIEKDRLYDAYKLIATESELNKAIDSTFGITIYQTYMYQTLSTIRDINNDIKDNVFRGINCAELGEIRYYGFGKYRNSDTNFDSNELIDYERDLATVTLGADKVISCYSRFGALVTVGKADYDYDNHDSREDDIYQLNLVGSYEKDNLIATATAYLGKTNGDLERTLDIPTIHEKMEGDLDNDYYGIDLALEKRYELPKFNIAPRMELNSVHVKQESINEKGEYALDVDSVESTSVEGGLGFKIDKSFEIGNGYKLTPVFSAMYYRELADPYEDLTAKLTSIGSDKVKIQGYDTGRDRGVLYGLLGLEKNDFGVNTGVSYNVDTEVDEVTVFVGLGYKF